MGDQRESVDDAYGGYRGMWRDAESELARVREERDEAEQRALDAERTWTGPGYWQTDTGLNHRAAIDGAARYREALEPFAALADEVDRLRHEDDSTCPHRLRAGDLRRARAALEEQS